MKIVPVIIPLLLLAGPPLDGASAAPPFVPWNAEVQIADECMDLHAHPPRKLTPVFNGPQGAAYFLIRFFQVAISPQDGPNCRFSPVCSAYGKKSVERHGTLWGLFLACNRIIRCNPFTPPGDDPVPEHLFEK
jgi:uncharacterized protein